MKEKKIIKATIWYTVSSYMSRGIGFITIPLFARLLTKTEYGLVDNFFAVLSILSIIGTLGLSSSLISARFDFEYEIYNYIKTNIIFGLCISITMFAGYMVFNKYFFSLTSLNCLFFSLMFISIAVSPAYEMYIMMKQFQYDYKTVSILNILIPLIGIGLAILFINFSSYSRLLARVLGSQAPIVISGFLSMCYLLKIGGKISLKYIKYSIPICIPYTIHNLSGAVLNFSDRIMITKICGAENNSDYSMAYSISQIVFVMWSAMNAAFFPWLSEKLNENNYREIKSYSNKYLAFFVIFVSGILLIVPEILSIIGGEKYKNSIKAIPPLIVSYVFLFLYSFYVNIEQYKKNTISMALATFISAVLNVLLNLYFIPQYGYYVAAYTTMFSYLLMLVLHFNIIRKMKLDICYNNKYIMVVAAFFLVSALFMDWIYTVKIFKLILWILYVFIFIVYVSKNYTELKKIFKI